MKLDYFAEKLEQAGLGLRSKTIFIHRMPQDCKRGLLVKAPIQSQPIDYYLPGLISPNIQVIARANHPEDGESLINDASLALTTQLRQNFDPPLHGIIQINYIRPTHLPWNYPRSDSSEMEWSVNFDCSLVIG